MLRAFTDSTGVEWRVWSVLPSSNVAAMGADSRSAASLKGTPFADGWLCFESDTEKRRLTPIPSSWEFQTPARLEELCNRATRVPLRRHETRTAEGYA